MRRLFSTTHLVAASWIAGILLMPALLAAEDRSTERNVSLSSSSANSKLPQAARCSVREEANGWWLVSPSGKRFFSLGICEFNQGTDRQSYDLARPSYAGWKHYDSANAWAISNVQRLKSWGFTTI